MSAVCAFKAGVTRGLDYTERLDIKLKSIEAAFFAAHGCKVDVVRKLARREELRSMRRESYARSEFYAALFEAGWTLSGIAGRYGVTADDVREDLRDWSEKQIKRGEPQRDNEHPIHYRKRMRLLRHDSRAFMAVVAELWVDRQILDTVKKMT